MVQHVETNIGRLLVVEDDRDIRQLIVAQLEREGFVVESAMNLKAAMAAIARQVIDLIILDLNLPDGDGISLCRSVRESGTGPAIMAVTARDSANDRIIGLETGADDYLTKPFEPRELIARVKNLLRRIRQDDQRQRPRGARAAIFGPWRLDLVNRRLITPHGSLVMLSTAEYDILTRLLDSPHEAVSRAALAPDRVTSAMDRSTDNRIVRIRQKLALVPGGEDLILSVRNQGYLLASDVSFE
jgi:two-component system OmpR family response regulator